MRKLPTWITSAGLLLGTALWAAPTSAAPASILAGLQKQANSDVEPVHYRRYSRRGCWWHRGHWHCPRYPRYAYYDYPYYGGYYPPYYYGGPAFAFSFGGGRHWGGHRHWGSRHFHRGGRGRW
jgi:hypothetical protein